MKKQIIIISIFAFMPFIINAQTSEKDKIKTLVYGVAKAWTKFPKTLDKYNRTVTLVVMGDGYIPSVKTIKVVNYTAYYTIYVKPFLPNRFLYWMWYWLWWEPLHQ